MRGLMIGAVSTSHPESPGPQLGAPAGGPGPVWRDGDGCTVVVLSFCPPVDVAGRCEAGRSGDGAETETGRRQDGDEEQRRAFGLPSLLLKLEIL